MCLKSICVYFFLFLIYFLAVQHGMWDLSFLTRDRTSVPCHCIDTGSPGMSLYLWLCEYHSITLHCCITVCLFSCCWKFLLFFVLVYNVTPKMLVSPSCTYGLTNMYSSFLIVGFLKLSHDPLMGPGQHL